MSDEARDRSFSTLEIARLCGAFHSTVLRWMESGALKSRRAPGSSPRVAAEDLAAFMNASGLPLPDDLGPAPARLLIVDDEPSVTRILERILGEGDRFFVVCANNPVEGLIEVGRHQPDVLILDLRMPALDGYEVCRILKSSPATRAIRIVAMSGTQPAGAQVEFLARHADMFLRKPIAPKHLLEAVAALLD